MRRARRNRAHSFAKLRANAIGDDGLDAEFGVEDEADDDATTVRLRQELAAAAQPESGAGAALSKPLSSSATGESPGARYRSLLLAHQAQISFGGGNNDRSCETASFVSEVCLCAEFAAPVSTTRAGAPPASSGANAAASEVDVPRGETETLATMDRFPQTEVVDTQMLEDVPLLQTTAPVVQLLSPPAAELPQAPDELMPEAQELMQTPTTMHAAGEGDGATLLSSVMSVDEPIELAAALTETPAAPAVEEEDRVAAMAPNVRVPSPPIEPASGVATLGAAPAAEHERAEALQPSAALSAFGLASPPTHAALLHQLEFAAPAGGQQSLEQLAATSAPAPLPMQPPPSGPAQLQARVEQHVEPNAGDGAEPALQGAAAPEAEELRSLDTVRSPPPVQRRAVAVRTANALTEHVCSDADVG